MLLKKSQIGMTDLFIAIFVFFFIFIALILSWNWHSKDLEKRVAYEDLQIKSFQITDLLVKTSGAPSSWETMPDSENIETLGLAKKPNVISRSKVAKLINSSFITDKRIKQILNIEQYNFTLKIIEEDGSPKYEGGILIERGQNQPGNRNTISSKRPVLYENEEDTAILEFVLWAR